MRKPRTGAGPDGRSRGAFEAKGWPNKTTLGRGALAKLQYSTLEARVAQAVVEANQVSIRAKDAPVMVNAEPYKLVFKTP